jgi:hypothetical protein
LVFPKKWDLDFFYSDKLILPNGCKWTLFLSCLKKHWLGSGYDVLTQNDSPIINIVQKGREHKVRKSTLMPHFNTSVKRNKITKRAIANYQNNKKPIEKISA